MRRKTTSAPPAGCHDAQARGGHRLDAMVWPTLELFLTACLTPLVKKHAPETNLFLFALNKTTLSIKTTLPSCMWTIQRAW
jgi:hypothetical protein